MVLNNNYPFNNTIEIIAPLKILKLTLLVVFREVVGAPDGADSLSSTLAGLRESYYDYNIAKHSDI